MPRSNDFVGRKGGAVPAMFANKDRAGDKPLFLLANTFDLAAKDYESSPLGSVLRRGGGGGGGACAAQRSRVRAPAGVGGQRRDGR